MKYSDLTPEYERALVTRYRAGDREAARILQETFERMVWARARTYEIVRRKNVEDVGQIIRLGVLEALHRFDWADGHRLLTYVDRFAVGLLLKELAKDSAIAVKQTVDNLIRRRTESGKEIPARLLRRLAMRQSRSLDEPIDVVVHGEGFTLSDILESDLIHPDVAAEARDENRRVRSAVANALAALSENERRAVVEYFMADEERTLKDVGDDIGMTPQGVQECIKRALPKLHRSLCVALGVPVPKNLKELHKRPTRVTRDELVGSVLRIVHRGSSVCVAQIAEMSRGTIKIDTAKYMTSLLAADGLLSSSQHEDDRGYVARHFRLTPAGLSKMKQAKGRVAPRPFINNEVP